ncbi:lactate dehydrogenase [Lachnoclostridium sp. An169]|uniref:D-isomer specific 2-hydroxyacid dehydrogenase family protein n=1 Tax=Lachnoclostridium sp. An169 TaxID=1965569 RepID=UPI000B3676C1|nr:D-isomer specific 2-hydroxyacid dehydrogenase family protein [Lachnoclostridium sp. An169]OUP84026.1 lactate dehydrogenase [Lachnoclostridium sp. An169]
MKIYAFEVRDDEIPYFQALSGHPGVELVLSSEGLTADKIPALEKGAGVSVLGMYHYGPEELALLRKQEILFLSTRTIGYNHIDIDYAGKNGIHICNSHYDPNGVADYTIMMILLCLRNYKQALWRTQVNDYSLSGLIGRELKDLTVGIVGTGSIGSTVIRELSGFGCRILAYSRHQNQEAEKYAEYVPLETLYRESDIISLHLPLTRETRHMINRDTLAMMKKGVVLINCARGALMEMQALIDGIESEHIGALGLDCMEYEENIVHRDLKTDIFSNRDMAYLRQFKNVIHTQHMAFYTDSAVRSMVYCGVNGILDMAQGKDCKTQLC